MKLSDPQTSDGTIIPQTSVSLSGFLDGFIIFDCLRSLEQFDENTGLCLVLDVSEDVARLPPTLWATVSSLTAVTHSLMCGRHSSGKTVSDHRLLCLVACSYAGWLEIVSRFISRLSVNDRAWIFQRTRYKSQPFAGASDCDRLS